VFFQLAVTFQHYCHIFCFPFSCNICTFCLARVRHKKTLHASFSNILAVLQPARWLLSEMPQAGFNSTMTCYSINWQVHRLVPLLCPTHIPDTWYYILPVTTYCKMSQFTFQLILSNVSASQVIWKVLSAFSAP